MDSARVQLQRAGGRLPTGGKAATSLRAGRAVGGARRYQAGHWQCRSRHCDVGRWHWPGPGARGGPGRHTGRGVGRTGHSQAWAGGLRGNGARGTHSQTAGARARGMGPGTGRCHCTWMKGTTTSGSTSDGRCGLGCWLLAQGRGMWTGCWGVCCLVANPSAFFGGAGPGAAGRPSTVFTPFDHVAHVALGATGVLGAADTGMISHCRT